MFGEYPRRPCSVCTRLYEFYTKAKLLRSLLGFQFSEKADRQRAWCRLFDLSEKRAENFIIRAQVIATDRALVRVFSRPPTGVLPPRPPHDLHPNRQPFFRIARRNNDCGKAQKVEPLAITPRIKVFHRRAINLPFPFSMTKRRNSSHRTNQHAMLPHLQKKFLAQSIALQPCSKKRFASVGGSA